eukprot:TRINITY_DN3130_c0_g1_i1.p1 TRINITY_DN3130_c0_g1~~TRINITY_DN3130_c0_g1_i1.p1  ORF type:complete len:774 (-),score=142.72 TRINITY_DN3130_c0_g1_i1:74-2395(-)
MLSLLCVCVLLALAGRIEALPFPLQYVNTFIGTGGDGYGVGSTPPGPQVPFGSLRVGPDTSAVGDVSLPFLHFGGYYYNDYYVRCFSHTHMVGAGVQDYGTIGIMPVSAASITKGIVSSYGYRSTFTHEEETAQPGYYSVLLGTWNVLAELTATMHVAIHRYTFATTGKTNNYILFPISYTLTPDGVGASNITIDPTTHTISGYVLNNGGLSNRFGGVRSYFYARTSVPFLAYGTWLDGNVTNGGATTANGGKGVDVGGYISFGPSPSNGKPFVVELQVGISWISVQQAKDNLEGEIAANDDFDTVRESTQNIWQKQLGIITVDPSSNANDDLIKFYTALYHANMAPTTFSEYGGVYLGFDNQVHKLTNGSLGYYTDMSIWDVHRSQFPWLALSQPVVMRDIVRSLLLMYEQGGDIPRWPLANGYTGCMIATHADIVIADAYFKGIVDFDHNLAYKGMVQGATTQQQYASRDDIVDWLHLGYVPYEASKRGASETLEYAYDDWAIGNLANALGNKQDAATFWNRSQNYKNVWNEEKKLFCPKDRNGKWECPLIWIDVFDPRYVEGDAWQWRWFVPHDVPGLVELYGGQKTFAAILDDFFSLSQDDPLNVLPNPYYWAGNEPDIFAPYMFAFGGRSDLTQKYVRWLLENKYTSASDGLPGNDDYGTMSAWFLFSSLGFYPLAGSANGTYILGSPMVNNATFSFPRSDGSVRPLRIITYDQSALNVYVAKVALGGTVLATPFITHQQLMQANTLEFWMTDTPSSSSSSSSPHASS